MTLREYLDSLKEKTVAVIGIGVSNTPLLRLLLREKIRVTACDKRDRAALGALAEELENQCAAFLVAQDGDTGKVVGYAGLLVVADEGYITNVAVFPEYRRRGVAAQLLSVFENFARGNHLAFLTLEVRPSNTAAIALYESFGFRQAGRRKNYYDLPKEDALILTKTYGEAEA